MSLIVWLASAMVISSIPLAWWALSADSPAGTRTDKHLAGLSPTMRQTVLQRSPLERLILPLTRQIGSRLIRLTPLGWAESRNRALARAGLKGQVTAEQILGAKLVVVAAMAALTAVQGAGDPPWHPVAVLPVAAVGGFFIPDLLIRARGDRRAEAITVALPDLLDQVTISVEAGLGLEAALRRICTGRDHPLARELLLTLQDIRIGSTRSDALEALAERSQVDDLKTVVLTLRLADTLGVPLADTLRIVAGDMREKRRFRAEERAQRLPTLMILPLGLCILPAMFIVVLGPGLVAGSGLSP